jgi:hypothetical protein
MRKLLSILAVLAVCISAFAQTQWPVYDDFSLPDPGKPHLVTRNSLQPTEDFLDQYPDGIPVATNEQLHQICRFYRDDPEGQKEWNGMASLAARTVSAWNIKSTSGFGASRYIYGIGNLKNISLVYIFTGNKMVGEFIRANLAKMVSLPITFWLHSELRGYNEAHPKGGLETASLNITLSYAVPAVQKDMSEDELAAIKDAWRERAHIPSLNWLENLRANNWTAQIGCGALYSSNYLGDVMGRMRALNALKYYADATIESDGSYAEGYGYFSYPIDQLFYAALVMSPREIRATFGKSSMRGSMSWRIYGHLFDIEEDGTPGPMRISFGDNPYGNREMYTADKTSLFMQLVYHDGIAKWIRSKYGSRNCVEGILLRAKLPDKNIPMLSPEGAELPLVKAFEDGENYIRSNWDDEGIVLAMKTGDGGSRVGYSHTRPELNSIALGAFGEYLIVTPGAASYRSQVHNEYDVCTISANTITIDGMNQKSPMWPSYKEGRWDNRKVVVRDTSRAVLTRCEALPGGGAVLESDAKGIYHIPMKEAVRYVRFVPVDDGGFFIVRDRMKTASDSIRHFDYRLHIFNRDEKTIITGNASKMLKIERPKAHLYIAVSSPAELKFRKEKGYMHHPEGRDYDEFGPKQGKPGSAIGLDWSHDGTALDIVAVIYPVHPEQKAPKIKITPNEVIVNGTHYTIYE